MNRIQERILSADLIRVVAMFFVILMHTTLNFTIRPDFFATKLWWLFTIGYKFFVLYDPSHGNFWQIQALRLISFPSSPLWFIEVLVMLYLLNPLLQLVFASNHQQIARYLTGIAFVFTIGTTFALELIGQLGWQFTTFTAWTGFAFFYLYGGLLRRGWIKPPSWRWNVAILIVSLLSIVLGDYLTGSLRVNESTAFLMGYTESYLSIPVVVLALTVFHLLLGCHLETWLGNWWGKRVQSGLVWLSGLTFGIYLIHMFVVGFYTDIIGFDFNKVSMNVYVFNALNVFLVLGISLVLTWIIKSIPLIRASIGERA